MLFFFFSQQVKWNHFIMTSVLLYDINIHIFVVSSRRNKTNPHHRNKFIPVLNATHLQAFKPKLSTYDQLLKTDQQDVSLYMCVCISWNIFNRIHFFAICDVFDFAISSFLCDISIYDDCEKLTKQLRQTFFFSSYTIYFTLLINCM